MYVWDDVYVRVYDLVGKEANPIFFAESKIEVSTLSSEECVVLLMRKGKVLSERRLPSGNE